MPDPANLCMEWLQSLLIDIQLFLMSDNNELLLAKKKLFDRIEYWTEDSRNLRDTIPGLWMYRYDAPTDRKSVIQRPSVCLIGQGSKQIFLGKDILRYDRDHYLVTSIDLPVVAQIIDASPEKPYMGMAFRLEQKEIAQLLAEGSLPQPPKPSIQRAMTVGVLTLAMIKAFVRLIDLLDDPVSIPFLAPPIKREILYRLITSPEGFHLKQLGMTGSQNSQIGRAVDWLKSNYAQSVVMEELASYCHMNLSSFHHHFKNLTAMSPLQYQKNLRLQEARRLMLVDDFDVTRAAFGVGYESSSQFCREYNRQFGSSPARNIRAIKNTKGANL